MVITEFGDLHTEEIRAIDFINPDTIAAIQQLQIYGRYSNETLSFYDFDATINDDGPRFHYLKKIFGKKEDIPRGDIGVRYIRDNITFPVYLNAVKPENNALISTTFPFEADNPNHIILTAGPVDFQELKVTRAYKERTHRTIYVTEAYKKIQAILEEIVRRGVIPKGGIRFFDDKMNDKIFHLVEQRLKSILKVPVELYQAKPHAIDDSVYDLEEYPGNRRVDYVLFDTTHGVEKILGLPPTLEFA